MFEECWKAIYYYGMNAELMPDPRPLPVRAVRLIGALVGTVPCALVRIALTYLQGRRAPR